MRLAHWVLFLAAIVVTAAIVYSFRMSGVPWSASRTAGVCLLLLSFTWIAIARIQLGRAFSVTAQARQLVTTGLYRYIRNPIYFASPFVVVGFALVVQQWSALLLLLLVIPLQIVRARREAAALRSAFGVHYETYRRRTWF